MTDFLYCTTCQKSMDGYDITDGVECCPVCKEKLHHCTEFDEEMELQLSKLPIVLGAGMMPVLPKTRDGKSERVKAIAIMRGETLIASVIFYPDKGYPVLSIEDGICLKQETVQIALDLISDFDACYDHIIKRQNKGEFEPMEREEK